MKIKCTAHIAYEFIVEAEDIDEAQDHVFECLADDIGQGIIPTGIFESGGGCFPIPMLQSVDMAEVKDGDAA